MDGKTYPSDMIDEEWAIIEPLIPLAKPGGRPRTQDMRKTVDAIFYLNRAGCQWRMMPHDYPAWYSVYGYCRKWQKSGTWQKINDALRIQVRERAGREAEPSAAILDSQSVKTTEVAGPRGYDAGKKINGRKRHILVDTMGLLLIVVVHVASIQDRDGAKLLFSRIAQCFPRLKLIWADGGYAGKLVDWVKTACGWILEIVKRPDDVKGFVVLPRRWVVERTFGWQGRCRRMSKDYEGLPECSESMIYISMTRVMLKRLARSQCSLS